MNLGQAQSLVSCVKHNGGFVDTQTFLSVCAKSAGITALNNISVHSSYFLVQVDSTYKTRVLVLNSLMVTQLQKNNTLKVITVWQSFY